MFNIKIAVLGLDIIAAVVLSFRNCVKCVPIKDVNSSKKKIIIYVRHHNCMTFDLFYSMSQLIFLPVCMTFHAFISDIFFFIII